MDDALFKEDDDDITKVGKVKKHFMKLKKPLINSPLNMTHLLNIIVPD